MEVNQQVWLRRESSHWGWVPAVIVRKEEISSSPRGGDNNNSNNDSSSDEFQKKRKQRYVDITLVNDKSSSLNEDERAYFQNEEDFTQIIRVEKESLKTADHADIKLRNITSDDISGGELSPRHSVGGSQIVSSFRSPKASNKSSSSHSMPVGGVDDLIGLTHLHEPAILHALRLRYDSDIIYTSTGPILIAVNPFKPMPTLYQSSTMDSYRIQGENSMKAKSEQLVASTNNKFNTPAGKRRGSVRHSLGSPPKENTKHKRLSPHVYQAADDAYRQMLRGLETQALMQQKKGSGSGNSKASLKRGDSRIEEESTATNQSILVSGESGAGKTVTTKIVLDYFAMLSKKRSEGSSGGLGAGDEATSSSQSQHVVNQDVVAQRKSWAGRFSTGSAGTVPAGGGGRGASGRQSVLRSTSATDVSIEQQVLQSNPIVEAFGNARTIRNDNSSRFGKYIDISFTAGGKLVGASIETYLLEKVRLIHPSEGERNYHIFYQFLASANSQQRQDFFLGSKQAQDFRLLADSGTFDRRDGVEDGATHQEMLQAMTTIGFSEETIYSLMRLVSAILFAGNMSFTPSDEDGDSCTLDKTKSSLATAALLGITFDGLSTALTKRSIVAADSTVVKLLTIEESGKACEALIKAVYGGAFDFIVEKINASLDRTASRRKSNVAAAGVGVGDVGTPGNNGTHNNNTGASIGVLDIFGFETFEYNSFEQLCINYTNEALQQQFNRYVFKLEQQEYSKEGILWKFIEFPDNQDVLNLIDMKHTGIIALLDEQCMLPKSTDQKFTRYLYARCDRHSRFCATSAQRVDYLFSIEHYAGLVEYTTEGWLEKNKDQLPASASELIQSSDFDLLLELNRFVRTEEKGTGGGGSGHGTPGRGGGRGGGGGSLHQQRGTVATKSVATKFAKQLKTLRSRIETTVPHYIRCLKPNDDLCSDYFEPKNIVEQLRCGGVLEAVRVSRAGYPTRYPHDVFTARYYILGNRDASHNAMAPMSPLFHSGGVGSSQQQQHQQHDEEQLKRLISKMALDLWQLDHEIHVAQLELERKRRASNKFYDEVQTKPHKSAVGHLLTHQNKSSYLPSDCKDNNLAVESSMMSPPEFKRKALRKTIVNGHKQQHQQQQQQQQQPHKEKAKSATNSTDHKVVRPESREDFLELDFASRCAVAGLQLGRTKVFLRREAFDRIEAMRSEKFFNAAATIQKRVRGRQRCLWYHEMRTAAIIVQCFLRIKIAERRLSSARVQKAAIILQCMWRVFVSRQYVMEMQLARRIAAIIIQRRYREYKSIPEGPSDADITWAMTRIQSRWRGQQERIRYQLFLQELQLEHERMRQAEQKRVEEQQRVEEEELEAVKQEERERERERQEAAEQEERESLSRLQSSAAHRLSTVNEQQAHSPNTHHPRGMTPPRHAVHNNARQLTPVGGGLPHDEEDDQQQQLVEYDNVKLEDLFEEIQENNWAVVENILDKNPELAEAIDEQSGELTLHKIARHASAWTLLIDMVLVLYPKALIHRDLMGALPIHHASAHDNLQALEIIYSAYKEGINDTDKMGRLPIHVAANYDAVDAIKFLLQMSPEGAYTMVYRPSNNSGGGLPLHIACRNHGSIGVITALLAENFASAKRTDENGDLPLHLLLRCGEVVDPVVVKTLLTCFSGAVSRTDMNGDLPLAIAIKYSCSGAVTNAILLQFSDGAAVLDGDGHSPLHLAFQHCADDRTIMGLLNHGPAELATQVDKKTGLLPIQVATDKEHTHFIVHTLLKRDLPIEMKEKVRAQLIPHHYSWNHVVANCEDLYYQVITKILQSCTQPQVLALAHIEGPDGKIALAAATPVCKHEMRVMLRLFNTLEVVNQRPAYTNPVSDTQIFYALRYDPPPQMAGGNDTTTGNGGFRVIHEEKPAGHQADAVVEDFDDATVVSYTSKMSCRSALTTRTQHSIDEKLRLIRREKGQQVIAKLTSKSEIVERELKIRKEYHLSRHYVPAVISVHHTVQHAAYSEAMAEPGYCITMEGADTTAENLLLDLRRQGKPCPSKSLKRIGISLLHIHEHGIIHGDFGTHNIGKFGSRWKLLGVGGSIPLGRPTNPQRGFYHPPESITVEHRAGGNPMGKRAYNASVISIPAHPTYDIWAYGVVLYEGIAGLPLGPYACRGKRPMSASEVAKIGLWDETALRKALKHIPDQIDGGAARDLIKLMLHPDPQRRATSMREVLEHPFFSIGLGPQGPQGHGQIGQGQSQSLLDQGFVAATRNTNNNNNNNTATTIAVASAAAAAAATATLNNSFERIEEEEEEEPEDIMRMLRDRNDHNSSSNSNPNPNPHNNILQKTQSDSTDYSAENRENGGRNFQGGGGTTTHGRGGHGQGRTATAVAANNSNRRDANNNNNTNNNANQNAHNDDTSLQSMKSVRSFGGRLRKLSKNTFRSSHKQQQQHQQF